MCIRDSVYANQTLALDELSEEAASITAADICMEQAHDRVAEIRRRDVYKRPVFGLVGGVIGKAICKKHFQRAGIA